VPAHEDLGRNGAKQSRGGCGAARGWRTRVANGGRDRYVLERMISKKRRWEASRRATYLFGISPTGDGLVAAFEGARSHDRDPATALAAASVLEEISAGDRQFTSAREEGSGNAPASSMAIQSLEAEMCGYGRVLVRFRARRQKSATGRGADRGDRQSGLARLESVARTDLEVV